MNAVVENLRGEALGRAETFELVGEPPRPLRRPLREAEPYPVERLGRIIAPAVEGTADLAAVPIPMAAQSALAQASLAVQGHLNVELPTGDARPASLFLLTVASSGDRKSTSDGKLSWAIEQREKEMRDQYESEMTNYRNEKEAFDVARSVAKKGKKSREEIMGNLSALGDEPAPPRQVSLTFPEPTIEGLHRHYSIGQPSLGVFSDEGSMFTSGHGMIPENIRRTGAAFSNLWDGKEIKRLRAGDGATVLYGRRCAFHLMMQAEAAQEWLGNPALQDQGLFGRVLIAAPESLAGTRFYHEPAPGSRSAIDQFGDTALSILRRPLPVKDELSGELEPRTVPMTDDAKAMWRAFADTVERELGKHGKLRPIYSLANKAAEHAARLAVVLAGFENIGLQAVDRSALGRGIDLANWYLGEALRLAEVGAVSEEIQRAEKLLDWLRDVWVPSGGEGADALLISPPEIYHRGPGSIREAKAAQSAIDTLQKHGWLAPVEAQPVRGTNRQNVYRIRGL